MKKRVVMEAAARWVLGVVFIYASLHKIIDPGAFAKEIHNYRLLPGVFINPLAMVLPWLELFCGAALIVRVWTQGAALLVTAMMAAFTAGLTSAVARGLNISCGCFESGGDPASWFTVGRGVVLTALACFVFWSSLKEKTWNSRI